MISDLTPKKLAEINEFGEAEAQANFLQCAPLEFSRPFRVEVQRIGSVLVGMIPKLDSAYFNRILGLGVGETATERLLDEAIAVFQKAGCKNYMAQVSPLAQPAHYLEWLAARSFTPGHNWAKMVRGNEPAPVIPTSLRLEKIGKDRADVFARIVLNSFEMPRFLRPLVKATVGQPGWYHYLSFDGNQPAGAASMFVNGEVGWLGFDGTLKKVRKRGGQGAMFARRIQDGLAAGCKWFVTETGEDTPEDPNPSFHNMLRSGFQLAYLRRNYVHKAKANSVNEVRRALFIATYTLRDLFTSRSEIQEA